MFINFCLIRNKLYVLVYYRPLYGKFVFKRVSHPIFVVYTSNLHVQVNGGVGGVYPTPTMEDTPPLGNFIVRTEYDSSPLY